MTGAAALKVARRDLAALEADADRLAAQVRQEAQGLTSARQAARRSDDPAAALATVEVAQARHGALFGVSEQAAADLLAARQVVADLEARQSAADLDSSARADAAEVERLAAAIQATEAEAEAAINAALSRLAGLEVVLSTVGGRLRADAVSGRGGPFLAGLNPNSVPRATGLNSLRTPRLFQAAAHGEPIKPDPAPL
jgi:hypothetical protein